MPQLPVVCSDAKQCVRTMVVDCAILRTDHLSSLSAIIGHFQINVTGGGDAGCKIRTIGEWLGADMFPCMLMGYR